MAKNVHSLRVRHASAVPKKRIRHDRDGKRMLGTHVANNIATLFKIVSAQELKTTDALLHEAISGLLVSRGVDLPQNLVEKLREDGLLEHFEKHFRKASRGPKPGA